MADLLFEIGCEELPPGLIKSLTNQLLENVTKSLTENNIPFNKENIKTFNTPRRIAIYIPALPKEQEISEIEVKGPPSNNAFDQKGNPTQAAIGFAKKYNLEPKDLLRKKINNIEYVFAATKTGGKKTKDILSDVLYNSIKNTTGEKFMKWGDYDEKFARPIRWILAILDGEIIDFTYTGVKSSNKTYGHRFLSSKEINISNPKDYENILEKEYVIVCPKKRKDKIIKLVEEEAQKIGSLSPRDYDKHLDEVTNITEYPLVLACSFDKSFCSLPSIIIETVLVKHQRYFVIYDRLSKSNQILPQFIVVTNGTETVNNSAKQVKAGNEKVVTARLNDVKFFLEEDLKKPFTFENRIEDLAKITFQKGLGSYKEKIERVIKLTEHIYKNLRRETVSKDELITAIRLSKLDLATHMVFEMPELQGEIGAIYAKANGFTSNISSAIKDHYLQCPGNLIGAILAVADKLDNIICLFSIAKIPSGSTDPFALRRQAQSIINIILEDSFKDLNINIVDLINSCKNKITPEAEHKIKDFLLEKFIDNLNFAFGFDLDLIKSVCSIGDPLANPRNTKEKISELKDTLESNEKFTAFLIAAKRLIRIVEPASNGVTDLSSLKNEEEKKLLKTIQEISNKSFNSTNEFLNALTSLTEPINLFFEKVLVNDPDPKIKQARQSLLKQGKDLFEQICDFNKIQDRS